MITIPMTVSVSAVSIPMAVGASTVEFQTSTGAAYSLQRNEDYDGEYEFTPTQETQTVQCAGLAMSENITINPIPSNYGLITYNGSYITVS